LRFVEKPDAATAAAMLAGGRHLWNAGLVLASAETLVAAFRDHAPDLCPPVAEAVAGAEPDLGFHRLAAAPWARARDVSLDYAVLERAANLWVMPYDGAWSDLGGWDAVWRAGGAGGAEGAGAGAATAGDGVVTAGHATAIDCRDTLLLAEGEGLALVGLGLSDIVAVAMPDAVLVARRDRAQDVRLAVAALESAGRPQATAFPRAHRPWGWFETLARGERFQVKRITVHPGGQLSRQSHLHRAEHWVVVAGAARVSLGERVLILAENQSIYVPQGEVHRLENPGRLPLTLIEVQTGSYLGEDDITRYEDAYRRG
jgi:mannose-1-phosphate guanylyltransferase/mannose-6-phosphate isomerase